MTISRDVGIPLVKAFEGCLKPVKGSPGQYTTYVCPAGVLTIGWGSTNLSGTHKIKPDDIWSKAQCDAALTSDFAKVYEPSVDKAVAGLALKQHQKDPLYSFNYNTGGIAKSSIPAKLKAGDFKGAMDSLERWNKGGGRVLPGLVRRRKAERLLFEGRIDEGLKVAGTVRDLGAMAQQVDRPTPPLREVTKRAPGAVVATTSGTVAAGGEATGAAPASSTGLPSTGVMIAGAIVMAIGVALLVKAYRKLDAVWA